MPDQPLLALGFCSTEPAARRRSAVVLCTPLHLNSRRVRPSSTLDSDPRSWPSRSIPSYPISSDSCDPQGRAQLIFGTPTTKTRGAIHPIRSAIFPTALSSKHALRSAPRRHQLRISSTPIHYTQQRQQQQRRIRSKDGRLAARAVRTASIPSNTRHRRHERNPSSRRPAAAAGPALQV